MKALVIGIQIDYALISLHGFQNRGNANTEAISLGRQVLSPSGFQLPVKAVVYHELKLSVMQPSGDKNGLLPGLLTLAGLYRILQQVAEKTAQIDNRKIQHCGKGKPCPELDAI